LYFFYIIYLPRFILVYIIIKKGFTIVTILICTTYCNIGISIYTVTIPYNFYITPIAMRTD